MAGEERESALREFLCGCGLSDDEENNENIILDLPPTIGPRVRARAPTPNALSPRRTNSSRWRQPPNFQAAAKASPKQSPTYRNSILSMKRISALGNNSRSLATAPSNKAASQNTNLCEPKDIICMRGHAGSKYPGNTFFLALVRANKAFYDTLSASEKEAFVERLYEALLAGGHRFVKKEGTSYHVITREKGITKITLSIGSCLTKTGVADREVSVSELSQDFSFVRPEDKRARGSVRPDEKRGKGLMNMGRDEPDDERKRSSDNEASPNKKMKSEKEEIPPKPTTQPKCFDSVAKQSISDLMSRDGVRAAMTGEWGDQFEAKKSKFEEGLLPRYRAAALSGMPTSVYSDRLEALLTSGD